MVPTLAYVSDNASILASIYFPDKVISNATEVIWMNSYTPLELLHSGFLTSYVPILNSYSSSYVCGCLTEENLK